MLVPAPIREAYQDWSRLVLVLARRAENELRDYCRKAGFLFDGRIKGLESVAEKLESGRAKSWESLNDLYACTIVVPLPTDEPQAVEWVRSRFMVLQELGPSTTKKSPDVFRFDGIRMYVRFKPPANIEPNAPDSIYLITFEIQVKSVFEFAWSRTTHALAYKAPTVDWRRQRLAAQLKAIVEQVNVVLEGFEQTTAVVADQEWPEIDDKRRLYAYFFDKVRAGQLPEECTPKDWSRFCDNVYTAIKVFSGHGLRRNLSKPLAALDMFVMEFEEYLRGTPAGGIPKSLSLFQLVVGVMGASPRFHGVDADYSIPIDPGVRTLFPAFEPPGPDFGAQPLRR